MIDKVPILKRIRKSDIRKAKVRPEDESLAVRVLTIVNEGREDRYMQMFNSIPKMTGELGGKFADGYQSLRNGFNTQVKWAIQALKREDRIIWYLRFELVHCLAYIVMGDYFFYRGEDPDKDLIERSQFKLKELVNKTGYGDDTSEFQRLFLSTANNGAGEALSILRLSLMHYLSLPVPEIHDYIFNNQSIKDLKDDLDQLEKKWYEAERSQIKQSDEEADHEVTDLITFRDGWKWLLKDTEECSIEAKAMGHCGNAGNPQPGDRILSLREPTKKPGVWAPHCTFILREDGFLSEMKGRENKKPVEKYHSYIIELLRNDIIKGIVGGGYLPENNFSMDDLTQEQRDTLYKVKPTLMPIEMYLPSHGLDEYSKRMFKNRLAEVCPDILIVRPKHESWLEDPNLEYYYYGIVMTTVREFFDSFYSDISPSAKIIINEITEYGFMIVEDVLNAIYRKYHQNSVSLWQAAIEYDPNIETALVNMLEKRGYSDDYQYVYEEELGSNRDNLLKYLLESEKSGGIGDSSHTAMTRIVEEVLKNILNSPHSPLRKLLDYIADDDLESGLGIGRLKIDKEEGEELTGTEHCTYFVNVEDAINTLNNISKSGLGSILYSDSVQFFRQNIFKKSGVNRRKRYSFGDPYEDRFNKVLDSIEVEEVFGLLADFINGDSVNFPTRWRRSM